MANKPGESNFFPDVPVYPEMGTFQPVYGKFDLTTYIQGASDYEIMAFLVGKYNACLEAYGTVTKLSTETVTACKQLQDWINSWFDNLDVQEELNKKIDSMVADGSFEQLLHKTFDEQINQQTVSATTAWLVANVTPTGSAVMIDKSLTIEGAAADAKATGDYITANKKQISTKLNSNASINANLAINSEVHEGFFTNGEYADSSYFYFLINATIGQKFYLYSPARYIANYAELRLLAENQNNEYTSTINGTLAFTFNKENDIAVSSTNDFSNIPFYNTPYYTVNLLHQSTGDDNKKPMSQKAITAEVNNINDFVMSGKKEINNELTSDGTYVILASSVVYNPSYRLTPAFKFNYDVLVSATGTNIRYGEFNSDDRNDLHKSYTDGVSFPLVLRKEYYHRFSYNEGTSFKLDALVNSAGSSESVLTDKTVYNFGDSLMYGHYSGEGILDGLCAETGALLTKYAINGATVLGSTGLYNIENQVKGASDVTPDFVIFDGLMNDDSMLPNYTTKLGALSSSFDENTLDINTFYGAFEHLLYAIRTKYTNTNMIFVCCHKTPSRDYSAQETLQKAVRECCEKWSVPYVDIYNDGQINCYFDNLRKLYSYDKEGETSGGSGTHLTGEGYNKFYAPIIKAKMIELMS